MVCISFILRVEVHQERDVRTKMGWLMERDNGKEKGKVAERNLLLPSLQNPTLGIFIMGGHQAAPLCLYAFHLHGQCWWQLFNCAVLVGLIWTTNLQEKKMGKAEFKFCRLGKHFYGTMGL
jgi:hypothetical protein